MTAFRPRLNALSAERNNYELELEEFYSVVWKDSNSLPSSMFN
jgi:hypothetical protein